MLELDPLKTLEAYLSHQSVSTDPEYADGMSGARDFARNLLEEMGFSVEVVSTDLHPILYAERIINQEWPHVVLYGHYDVQPADPEELWTTPPFTPKIRDGRLYARGSADNKGPTIVHMTALTRVLKEHPDLPLNITYVIEGEEEIGSPSMPKFFDRFAGRLSKADYLLVSDTGSPSRDQIVVTTALRGLVGVQVEVTGARTDLHSGVHGGAVMNPIRALTQICASLHNDDGTVNIPGFYDNVITAQPWEREELTKYPSSLEAYRSFLGVDALAPPAGYSALEAVRFAPTLEFNGIAGGYQGEGTKTVIPRRAFVKITCRLVSDQDPDAVLAGLKQAVLDRAPAGVKVSFRDGGIAPAYLVVPPNRKNTPEDQPQRLASAFAAVDKAVESAFGKRPLYLREGGSIPVIADFKRRAGLDAILLGLFTPEDNLHAPDESFDLKLMERAITAFESIFKDIAGV